MINTSQYKRPESVLVLVYTEALQILLLRRIKPPVGLWQSVTGSLHWSETPIGAAKRELYEETGLQVSAELLDTGVVNRFAIVAESLPLYEPGVTHNVEYVFQLCIPRVCNIKYDPIEHNAVTWLPISEAAEKTHSWSNRAAILALLEK